MDGCHTLRSPAPAPCDLALSLCSAPRTASGHVTSESVLPSTQDKTRFVRSMFDTIAGRYDLVNRLMTFGLDQGWRRRAITELGLAVDSLVLDLGCGTGDLTREAVRQGLRPIGVDLSFAMLAASRRRVGPLVEADAETLPIGDGSLDGLVSGFALRNFTDLPKVLNEIARILKTGGRLVILEVDRPRSPLLRLGDDLWFRHVVPKIGALFSDAAAYRYLPESVAYLPNPAELHTLLSAAGFSQIRRTRLQGGLAQIVAATKAAVGYALGDAQISDTTEGAA